MLLGFARHLNLGGFLDPPCTLPNLPRRVSMQEGNNKLPPLGALTGQTNIFPAPVRQLRRPATPVQKNIAYSLGVNNLEGENQPRPGREYNKPDENKTAQGGTGGEATAVPKWFSPDKDLCEGCWALRVAGGSKCPRCGRRYRRGFFKGKSNRAAGSHALQGDGGGVGPVPWQQFSQVCDVKSALSCNLSANPRCMPGSTPPLTFPTSI